LPPGTPAAGTATLSPASGTSATTFSLAAPVGSVCPGDNTAGYLYHSFIIPFGQDPADMTFSPSGTPNNKPQFSNNLANAIGTRSRNIAPGLGDGLVVPISSQTFSNAPLFGALTPGAYTVGIACTQPDAGTIVQTMRFWSTNITISGSLAGGNLTYATGVAPAAPTITGVTEGNQSCTVAFTPGAGGATSFTVTGTPGGSATGSASPIAVTGLTNGTPYTFTVTGTNSVGTSAPSAVSATCTPVAGPRTNVTALTATPGAPGSGIINLAWTAPGANTPAADPVSYAVSWTGPTPGTATVPFGTNSYSATGLNAGSYTFTVVATYADSPTSGSPAATVSAASSPSSVVIQDIDVQRPVGALVLTQVCNSNGPIPADPTPSTGFPSGVPAVSAVNGSTVGSPTQTGNAPLIARGGAADANFAEYPYPINDTTFEAEAAYPTYCGINLGRARFVTRGAGAGQFFAATGVIDQITIVDTRDDDPSWTVSGQMGDFSANGGTDIFSGSQLGWAPQKTEDTGAFTDSLGNTYDQVATAGPVVQPNTAAATGLSNGSVLMQANAGAGLGIAIADARLKLLIPVTADSGVYTGVLTFSAA
jgi:large repetitive protein